MPYIPENHLQYPVLPYSRERGGEVFEYPSWPEAKFETLVGEHLIPYGYKSYEEYYLKIDSLIELHHDEEETVRLLKKCKENIALFNHKEDWSICKYIGEDTGEVLGLHKGGYYYWPCLASEGKYRGVIDDEEFTAYQYPTDPDLWEIIVDPTGMAERTIYGGENALSKEAHEYIMRQVRNMQPEDMKDVRTLGPAPRLNKLEREKEGKTDMNKTVFGGYMELNEEETLARVYMSDDEVPVNISLDEESDMALETGVDCSVDLWSNEYEVSIYPSEEEYEKADTKMATISMIPMGTFPANNEWENFKQNAFVLFTGIVREVERNPEPEEGAPLWRLRIETYSFAFDLFYFEDEPFEPGFIVHGRVWLYGTLKGLSD